LLNDIEFQQNYLTYINNLINDPYISFFPFVEGRSGVNVGGNNRLNYYGSIAISNTYGTIKKI